MPQNLAIKRDVIALVLDQCRVTANSILLVELRSQQMSRLNGGVSAQLCDGQRLRFQRRVEALQLRRELRIVRFIFVLVLVLRLRFLFLLRCGRELRRQSVVLEPVDDQIRSCRVERLVYELSMASVSVQIPSRVATKRGGLPS